MTCSKLKYAGSLAYYYAGRFPYCTGIMPYMLSSRYYAENYACIIDTAYNEVQL